MRSLVRSCFFVLLAVAGALAQIHAQTANPDFYSSGSYSAADGVLANDDPAGAASWSVQLVTGPTNGIVNLSSDGAFTYTANAGAFGKDTFAYKIIADANQSSPATVSINIGDQSWSDAFSDLPGVRSVNALSVGPNGDLFVGGLLAPIITSSAVVNPYGIARWDGARWNPLGNGHVNGVNSTVYCMQWVGTNLIVSGQFGKAGGRAISSVGRWDGHQWFGFGSGIVGAVYALACKDDVIYAAGQFQAAGGVAATNIARWDGTKWESVGEGVDGVVRALALDDAGELFAGGLFETASGVRATNIARWNGSQWSAVGSGVNGQVNATLFQNGNLYVAGKFTRAGPLAATNVAQWTASEWRSLANGLKGDSVTALAWHQSNLAAALNSAATDASVFLWDGTKWSAIPASPTLAGAPRVSALFSDGNRLLAGGAFTQSSNAPIKYVASWDGQQWRGFNNAVNGNVTALAAKNGAAYVGGEFTAADDLPASHVARAQNGQWQTVGAITNNGVNGPVNALLIGPTNELYAAGNFSMAGSVPAGNVAVFDGQTWGRIGATTNQLNGEVFALALNRDNQLFAGGAFTQAGSAAAPAIAMWDGKKWNNVGGGITGRVYALAADGPYLYAGGAFTKAGGISASTIARWDGVTWSPLGAGPGNTLGTRVIYAIAVRGTEVFVAGQLNDPSNRPAHLFRWDGSNWSPVISSISGNGTITSLRALQIRGDHIFVGGTFDTFNGVAARSLAFWDGAVWKPIGTSLDDINLPTCNSLAIDQDKLYVGGLYSTAGRKRSLDFAQWQLSEAVVSISASANPAAVFIGSPVTVNTELSDRDNLVRRVDFYDGNTLLGSASTAPFNFTWNNPFTGDHDVYAHAFGANGRLAVSQALRIRVFPPDGNAPPAVELTLPEPNAVFAIGDTAILRANASDADGIREVRFFANGLDLGAAAESPYSITWPSTIAGSFSITARATDNVGLVSTSAPVNIRWQTPPVVFVSNPRDGDVIPGPLNLLLTADARDDKQIARVEFFINGALLGPTTQNSSPDYELIWTNAPVGVFQITAKAYDYEGGATLSAPISITIEQGPAKPLIDLLYPLAGAHFSAPTNINLQVSVSAPGGRINRVDYFNGAILIGSVYDAPFNFDWRNVPAGEYCLIAKALDDAGQIAVSEETCITLTNGPGNFKFTAVDLGTLGGAMTEPLAINGAGQVVGWSHTASPAAQRPFLYENNQIQEIGPLGPAAAATAINDHSQIAGYYDTNAFIFDATATNQMPGLGGDLAIPSAINNNGIVVGTANTADRILRAFVFRNGATADLGTFGGISSEARGINNLNHIVGAFRGSDATPHAFFYSLDSAQFTLLPAFGEHGNVPYAINDLDQIVGFTGTSDGHTHAFLMPATNIILDLGALGGLASSARALNNQGQIVGSAQTSAGKTHAFLWQNAVMFDLNTLIPADSPFELVEATGINDAGEIIAWGYQLPLQQDLPHRAYLLRPNSNTTSAALLPLTVVNNAFNLNIAAPYNRAYVTESSVDLATWTPIATNFTSVGILHLSDTNTGTARFYRTVPWNP